MLNIEKINKNTIKILKIRIILIFCNIFLYDYFIKKIGDCIPLFLFFIFYLFSKNITQTPQKYKW